MIEFLFGLLGYYAVGLIVLRFHLSEMRNHPQNFYILEHEVTARQKILWPFVWPIMLFMHVIYR